MGLVLDASVLIAAEEKPSLSSEVLLLLEQQHGETEIILSAITVIEMEHGFHRANTLERAQRRRDYLDTAFAAIPTEPFTKEMALLAAKIDAEAKKKGTVIPFADLLIGVTALQIAGRQHIETVESAIHQRPEVAAIERQQHVGPCRRREQHRPVFSWTKHSGPIDCPRAGNERQ